MMSISSRPNNLSSSCPVPCQVYVGCDVALFPSQIISHSPPSPAPTDNDRNPRPKPRVHFPLEWFWDALSTIWQQSPWDWKQTIRLHTYRFTILPAPPRPQRTVWPLSSTGPHPSLAKQRVHMPLYVSAAITCPARVATSLARNLRRSFHAGLDGRCRRRWHSAGTQDYLSCRPAS